MRRLLLLALASTAALSLHGVASAEPRHRIEVRAVTDCDAHAGELEQRLEQMLGDEFRVELEASVEIRASDGGYRADIETRDEAGERRSKLVLAPSCSEAVDSAVAVLALAFGERVEPKSAPLATESEPVPPVVHHDTSPRNPEPFLPPPPPQVDRGSRSDHASSPHAERPTRLALATGADFGTLSEPTAMVAGSVAQSFSALELRASGRYGFRTVQETVETGLEESVASDFAAFELRACYGTSGALRVSACAGAEAGAVRVVRRVRGEAAGDVDEAGVTPHFSGTFGALLARRGGVIEPEVELSGVGVALGRDEASSPLALRLSVGAAVAF